MIVNGLNGDIDTNKLADLDAEIVEKNQQTVEWFQARNCVALIVYLDPNAKIGGSFVGLTEGKRQGQFWAGFDSLLQRITNGKAELKFNLDDNEGTIFS